MKPLLAIALCLIFSGCYNKEKEACLDRQGAWVSFNNKSWYCVEVKIETNGKRTYPQ